MWSKWVFIQWDMEGKGKGEGEKRAEQKGREKEKLSGGKEETWGEENEGEAAFLGEKWKRR